MNDLTVTTQGGSDLATPEEIERRQRRFELAVAIAEKMALAPVIPEHLRGERDGQSFKPFDRHQVLGNCFLVANQALLWGLDPFTVAQQTSVVRGKLCYEGKLVAALIQRALGPIRLRYAYFGEPGTDGFGIRITHPDDDSRAIEGTVGDWATRERGGGISAQWKGASNQRRMLKYRGDREWARLWMPEVIMGVYGADEFDADVQDMRAARARPVPAPAAEGLRDRLAARGPVEAEGPTGFDPDTVEAGLAEAESMSTKPEADEPVEGAERARAEERGLAKEADSAAAETGEAAEHATATDPAPTKAAGDRPIDRYVAALAAARDRDALEKAHRQMKPEISALPAHEQDAFKVVLQLHQQCMAGKIDAEKRDRLVQGAIASLAE